MHYTMERQGGVGKLTQMKRVSYARRVVITGTKKVSDCTVMYEGSAYFPEEEGAPAFLPMIAGEEGEEQYTMKATGVYIPKKNHGAKRSPL